jgi:hypothetical protein
MKNEGIVQEYAKKQRITTLSPSEHEVRVTVERVNPGEVICLGDLQFDVFAQWTEKQMSPDALMPYKLSIHMVGSGGVDLRQTIGFLPKLVPPKGTMAPG